MARKRKENLKKSPDISGKVEQKEMVSLFDPVVNAYREFPVSVALKFIESAKEAEEKFSGQKNNGRKSNRTR